MLSEIFQARNVRMISELRSCQVLERLLLLKNTSNDKSVALVHAFEHCQLTSGLVKAFDKFNARPVEHFVTLATISHERSL